MVTATYRSSDAKGDFFRAALRQLSVVAVYAVVYPLLRGVSISHWNLMAGLRMLCLLVMPYRYWPAMMLGEAIPLAWFGWDNHERFGVLWAYVIAIPPLLVTAPAVAWFRRRAPALTAEGVNITVVMSCILAGSVVSALVNTATYASMVLSPAEHAPPASMLLLFEYFLGGYLGALTVAPPVLAVLSWWRQGRGNRMSPVWKNVLADCIKGVVPPLALLAWLAAAGHSNELTEVARMAMFLPVAWLTLRHGWQGAAIGGLLASVAIELTITVIHDPSMMQAQALISFAVSSLIMLGSRLAAKSVAPSSVELAGEDKLRGFLLAQQGLYQEELRLRHVAESLDRLGQSMRDGQRRMMDRLRPVLPASMEQSYARHLDLTQMEMQRLADTLHPREWREHGLAATFRNGPLSQAAAMVGAGYRCTFTGDGLNELAPDVHLMLYRQACEVLVYMLAREPLKQVHVHIRGGCTHGRRWVVLRMTGVRSALTSRGRPVPEWRQLVSLLGTNGQGMPTVHERAQIYGGTVHERESEAHLGVTLLLHDALRVEAPSMHQPPLARAASA